MREAPLGHRFIHSKGWTLPGRQLDFAGHSEMEIPQLQQVTHSAHWDLPGILLDLSNTFSQTRQSPG
jgi:hypothetical protein